MPAPRTEIENTRQLGVDRQPLAQTTPRHVAAKLEKNQHVHALDMALLCTLKGSVLYVQVCPPSTDL